jgi:hypothetical protein
MMTEGTEFYAESVFPVGADVQGVSQRDGVEDCKGCRQSEKEKQKPDRADLTGSQVKTKEARHAGDDGEKAKCEGGYRFGGREIFQ